MKFRKKQEVIEAEKFEVEKTPWPDGVVLHAGRHGVFTLSGFLHIADGDWVITNPDGDKRPHTGELFEEIYEAV